MRYQLLCCSDTHGHAPPTLEDATAAAWLHAGDIYNGPNIIAGDEEPLPLDPFAQPIRAWLAARQARVFAVHGNHDVADPYRWFSSVTQMDGRVERLASDLLLVGVGWNGERYYELPMESDLEKVCERVRRQLRRTSTSRDRLVLLTHYPPLVPGMFPMKPGAIKEAGYQAVADLVQELRPILIVQGHEHFWFGRSERLDLGDHSALIVNPGKDGMAVTVDTDLGAADVA